jgi:hypothetical protein
MPLSAATATTTMAGLGSCDIVDDDVAAWKKQGCASLVITQRFKQRRRTSNGTGVLCRTAVVVPFDTATSPLVVSFFGSCRRQDQQTISNSHNGASESTKNQFLTWGQRHAVLFIVD